MAHTPGPWRLRMNDSGMCNGVAVSATVLPPEPFTGPYIAEVGSTVANARLIAAAPDLLTACKAVMAQFDAGSLCRNTDSDGCSDWAIKAIEPLGALAALKSAIAKAEGSA